MNLIVRKYHAADRPYCIAIFNSNCPGYFDPSELKGLERWLNGMDKNEISYSNAEAAHFYVIEHESKVIACGGFYIAKETQRANMVWGMVHNELHLKGLGKELLLYRLEQIQELYPQSEVILDTSQHTFRFFEKLGFEVVNIVKEGYGKDLDRYDMIKITGFNNQIK